VIAIDGKSLNGAYEKGQKSSPRMMVSAYAAGLRLTLATLAAEDRNEVDAALEVIGLLKYSYASAGTGTRNHFMGEAFKQSLNLDLVHAFGPTVNCCADAITVRLPDEHRTTSVRCEHFGP
jgi:hypothetical protein